MFFTVKAKDKSSKARIGELQLPHATVQTPVFMPVGTSGTVKAVHFHELEQLGYKLILGNTYHLFLRPGIDILSDAKGLHHFSNWQHGILTDSGGYQVFSMADSRKIKEEGVHFLSHIDGSKHIF